MIANFWWSSNGMSTKKKKKKNIDKSKFSAIANRIRKKPDIYGYGSKIWIIIKKNVGEKYEFNLQVFMG